ncbi:MAG: hypothetical protein KatS3mg110_3446 [Pirellulaceae bacterium]|nr:MAG: hypothetical protein KatS3mg110_3446 [Pirellulaceae bacterium]
MVRTKPHYLLLVQAHFTGSNGGRWRFVLEQTATGQTTQAEDCESDLAGERLELLALVRGLEAIPGPARVTLVTTSRFLEWGLSRALPEWRRQGWLWEFRGGRVPIRHADLWQRVDRALTYHDLECRTLTGATAASRSSTPAQPADRYEATTVLVRLLERFVWAIRRLMPSRRLSWSTG